MPPPYLRVCMVAIFLCISRSSSFLPNTHYVYRETHSLWNGVNTGSNTNAFISTMRRQRIIPMHMVVETKMEVDVEGMVKESFSALTTGTKYLWKSSLLNNSNSNPERVQATVVEIIELCDALDQPTVTQTPTARALEYGRYALLQALMRLDYNAYVNTASFLSPSRIPRDQLPNVQDIPLVDLTVENTVTSTASDTASSILFNQIDIPKSTAAATVTVDSEELVPDCTLLDTTYNDSILDKVLLSIFRKLVHKNSNGIAVSSQDGILGLLEQGRVFMLQPNQTPEAQHNMVKETLRDLMTPALPPIYRLFMSGIVPQRIVRLFAKEDDATASTDNPNDLQLGPWFYAPYLTTVITPLFFQFLVGPSRPNARKDGQPGGLVVEKCKFLQESSCKGLCLHICKLPTQQLFLDELGMPLTVSPNFETQECQWSFGEVPLPPAEDPSFPKGCLVGCESRKAMAGTAADADCG